MNRVFIYATLKNRGILEKALGHKAKPGEDAPEKAKSHGFREIHMRGKDNERWPTLINSSSISTPGEIIEVNDKDLKKLDDWENRYRRQRIQTDKGSAWTYVLK